MSFKVSAASKAAPLQPLSASSSAVGLMAAESHVQMEISETNEAIRNAFVNMEAMMKALMAENRQLRNDLTATLATHTQYRAAQSAVEQALRQENSTLTNAVTALTNRVTQLEGFQQHTENPPPPPAPQLRRLPKQLSTTN